MPLPSIREEGAFDLDVAELERRYKALQLRLHPDRFGTASPLEREHAAQQAAAVNQAYDVLKRPLRRAHYIVSCRRWRWCCLAARCCCCKAGTLLD